jgi:hypothetical protein
MTEHADYPHEPNTLPDCEACQTCRHLGDEGDGWCAACGAVDLLTVTEQPS